MVLLPCNPNPILLPTSHLEMVAPLHLKLQPKFLLCCMSTAESTCVGEMKCAPGAGQLRKRLSADRASLSNPAFSPADQPRPVPLDSRDQARPFSANGPPGPRVDQSADWLRFKYPAATAVKREAKEDWGSLIVGLEHASSEIAKPLKPPQRLVSSLYASQKLTARPALESWGLLPMLLSTLAPLPGDAA